MALPKIALPKNKITTPSGGKITIRSFTGYEEKALLTAKAIATPAHTARAMWTLLDDCTDENIDTISILDAEFIFLHLFALSVSPDIKTAFVCTGCKVPAKVTFPISDIPVPTTREADAKLDAGSDSEGNTIFVVFKPISFKSVTDHAGDEDSDNVELAILFQNLEGIYVGEEEQTGFTFEEFCTWFLGLRHVYGEALKLILQNNSLKYEKDFTCATCGVENHVVLEGYKDFFH